MPRDPVELEVFKHLFHAIAEEMGAALRRTAFSPNIKERRDYSCAVFNGDYINVSYGSDGHANTVWTDMRDFSVLDGTHRAQFIYFART